MPDIWSAVPSERYLAWLLGAIRIGVAAIVGYVLTLLAGRVLRGVRNYAVSAMVRSGDVPDYELEKRATTLVTVIRRPLLFLIWVAVVITILDEMRLPIAPLLAGAGLGLGAIGVAIGLGAQSVIKDVLGGFFLLIENQIRVNDVAVINGTGGLVEEINLRTTVLRSDNGALHIFPNGSIQTLSNLTHGFAFYVFEVLIDFSEDPDRILDIMRSVCAELREDSSFGPFMLANLDVIGVDRIGGDGVMVKARIRTSPAKQWLVGREMNRRLRARFEAENVRLSSSRPVFRIEENGRPGPGHDELRAVVREALEQMKRERIG
jgi:small-conductance mechanosensitive channel